MQKEKRVWAVKLDERGRTTIPKDLLDLLGIRTGDIMAFIREDEGPVYVGKAELQVQVPFAQKVEGKRIEAKKV
ncbi:MAG: AbrB/MazE/SpoVT family DNA-binding domain-containing protein [Candidatus Bathyarchaeia archaeon]|nr:AbrB/MazE/SpoVT family DNA-binding domain-containing protein [Candidatus Bathyarchaeia archaeon]